LQDWTRENVIWALRQWNRDNPRIRPTPGDILRLCNAARGRWAASLMEKQKQQQPKPKPVSPDMAAEIMEKAGFDPRR